MSHVSERMEQLLVFGTPRSMGLLMLGRWLPMGWSFSAPIHGSWKDRPICSVAGLSNPHDGTPPVETFVSALEKLAASSGVDRHRAS